MCTLNVLDLHLIVNVASIYEALIVVAPGELAPTRSFNQTILRYKERCGINFLALRSHVDSSISIEGY